MRRHNVSIDRRISVTFLQNMAIPARRREVRTRSPTLEPRSNDCKALAEVRADINTTEQDRSHEGGQSHCEFRVQ